MKFFIFTTKSFFLYIAWACFRNEEIIRSKHLARQAGKIRIPMSSWYEKVNSQVCFPTRRLKTQLDIYIIYSFLERYATTLEVIILDTWQKVKRSHNTFSQWVKEQEHIGFGLSEHGKDLSFCLSFQSNILITRILCNWPSYLKTYFRNFRAYEQ